MKTNKKLLTIVILCAATIASIVTVRAAFWIYGNITNPGQAGGNILTINQTYNGTAFIITGTLTNNGAGIIGASVLIYTNATVNQTPHLTTFLGTATTGPSGAYTYVYPIADGKWYSFEPRYQVP